MLYDIGLVICLQFKFYRRLNIVSSIMFSRLMFVELLISIIRLGAEFTRVGPIWIKTYNLLDKSIPHIRMASFMVLLISSAREYLCAVLAHIWLLAGVCAHVDHQVAFLWEDPIAIDTLERFEAIMYRF